MNSKQKRPAQIEKLFQKIGDCIDSGRYRQSRHAIDQKIERNIDWPDVLYVLKHGYHEKPKTSFDEAFQAWKYAVRGRTLDEIDIRVIIAFDDDEMMIITVMHVVRK